MPLNALLWSIFEFPWNDFALLLFGIFKLFLFACDLFGSVFVKLGYLLTKHAIAKIWRNGFVGRQIKESFLVSLSSMDSIDSPYNCY